MPGGTFTSQNKVLPGIYINIKSRPQLIPAPGINGIVAIPKVLDWGKQGDFARITSIADVFSNFGYDILHEKMRFIRRIFRGTTQTSGASEILVFPLATTGGAVATATIGALTVTANYTGVRGNDVSIVITADPDTETDTPDVYAVFTVDTIVDGTVQDSQTVGVFNSSTDYTAAAIADLVNNDWVTFMGTGALTPTAGVPLTGGVTGTAATTAYSDFLTALDPEWFNVVIYDGTDFVIKSAFADFVSTRSYGTGRYCQTVVSNYPAADNETCISVKNGKLLNDDRLLTPEEETWWVAGATAGAQDNESLTYKIDPDAVEAVPAYSNTELETAVKEGSFVAFKEFGNVKVITDINTFTSFSPNKGQHFSKNRVIRLLFNVANDFYNIFSTSFIGVVDNDEEGRALFKTQIVGYLNNKQGNRSIQNFVADDVEVLPGENVDSIVINLWIQPVDAVEKVYMTVTVS
jgi:hypothetical protein